MNDSRLIFSQFIKDLEKNEAQQRSIVKRRDSILTKILRALGLIKTGFDRKISELLEERQMLLGKVPQVISDNLIFFRDQMNSISESNDYIIKEKESELLISLRDFQRGVQYLNSLNIGIETNNLMDEIETIREFIASYNVEFRKKQQREELLAIKAEILQAEAQHDSLWYGQNYFSKKEFYGWKADWGKLVKKVESYPKDLSLESDYQKSIDKVVSAYHKDEQWLKRRNQEFIGKEVLQYKTLFETIESKPLTEEQRIAIITDEAHTLVVAGAGTGKTSTIIGKAVYLLEKGLANSDEILLLSFNAAVADELERRLKSKLQTCPTVKTYHAFGLHIIAQATGTKLDVCELATDKNKFAQKIRGFINKRMNDTFFAKIMNEYFLYHLIPYKSDFEFNSLGEYIRYLKQFDFRSMKGDKVKSFEECYIANFLYMNGIEYVYEHPYEIRTVDENRRQYKPDFFLPKYKIYIEHFGIDRHGRVAPYISQAQYLRSMEWKRAKHAEHRTTLIETFHYEQQEGTLLSNLEKKLREKGVIFDPIPSEHIFDDLNKLGRVDEFTDLLCTFINLYKSSGKTLNQIEMSVNQNDSRTKMFLNIFSAIYQDYTEYLQSIGKIDFNDMLNDATKYLNEGKYVPKFKYVLVDEFQDISQSRYLFLKALVDKNKSKLYCVGDDWQSIYRFTGSDVSLMAEFDKNFDFCETCFLQETFRFNDRLCNLSTQFILHNPLQIQKNITSKIKMDKPAVTIIRAETENALHVILNSLAGRSEKAESVYVIGRYNWLYEKYLHDIPSRVGNLTVEYKTAHSSKGLEADYVIIVGLGGGKMGFPCQIIDDPILNLVLAEEEKYPNAEERRLFYVAITRARKEVFLIDDPRFDSSSFTIELLNEKYDIEQIGQLPKTDLCPKCKTGVIVQRISKHNKLFYHCNNYPYCDYHPKKCYACGKGYLIKGDFAYRCSNDGCTFKGKICPQCNEGYLVRKNYQKTGGVFYGCSTYPNCKYRKRSDSESTSIMYR